MSNQILKPKNPLQHPTEAFVEWYKHLTVDQKLRISVDLVYAVPQFNTSFTGDLADAPIIYLQAPLNNNYELLGRIGTLKTLIDVFLYVPSESEDVTSYYQTMYTFMIYKAQAAGRSEHDVAAAKNALDHVDQMRKDYMDLFTSWSDFSVSNHADANGSASPFSRRYLYRWLCQEEGRDDPFVANEMKSGD